MPATDGGWYQDEECTDGWNFGGDTVSGDTVLYAKWAPNVSQVNLAAIEGVTVPERGASPVAGICAALSFLPRCPVLVFLALHAGLFPKQEQNQPKLLNRKVIQPAPIRGYQSYLRIPPGQIVPVEQNHLITGVGGLGNERHLLIHHLYAFDPCI